MLYAIYAGMGGSFGGANFIGLAVHDNEEQAMEEARCVAIEEYESYERLYGVFDQQCDEDGLDYAEEIESWIDFKVIEIKTEEQLMELTEDESIDSDVICHFVTETFHK